MYDQRKVTLKQNCWFGDESYVLTFPDNWDVKVICIDDLAPLTREQLFSVLDISIKSTPLRILARNAKNPIILVDDLTRPTPVEEALSFVLTELNAAGIKNSDISILIACGTHSGIVPSDIKKKLGDNIPKNYRIIVHDCHHDCVQIGYTRTGTPIQVSRFVLESDFKIGIGGVYPHPIAGFSGGGKLLALGAGGYDTIRTLHDQKKGSQNRDGNIDHEFRQEVNEIVKKVGLDFSINLILNSERKVAGCFSGEPESAFCTAVDFYLKNFTVQLDHDADILISDMFPFDMDFQYAFDRGLWPFDECKKGTLKIILASSPQGISQHELFPIKNSMSTRFIRRMKYFRFHDFLQIKDRVESIQKSLRRRKRELYVVSPGLKRVELMRSLPKSKLIRNWDEMFGIILHRFHNRPRVQVVLYKTAPLLIPFQEKNDPKENWHHH